MHHLIVCLYLSLSGRLFIVNSLIIIQVKKPFRKNGRNVGMASTSIGRKEVSFIYVDHTINSPRGQDEEDVRLVAAC